MSGNPIRVCMLSFYFYPSYSGSAVQAGNLSRRLVERGIEPLFVSANLTGAAPTEVVDGLRVVRLPLMKTQDLQIPSFWLSLVWFFLRKRKSFDIIHAHGTFQHAVASVVGRWLRKPTILKVTMAQSDLAFHKHGRMWGRVNRYFVTRFDCFIAISTEVHQEFLARGFDARRIRVIPNGVDTDVFHPAAAESRDWLRSAIGLPAKPTVIYVGVIDARKNVDGILRVWKRVREKTAIGQLVLVGPMPREDEATPGPFFQKLNAYVRDNGLAESVIFVGQQADVPSYLRAADIFLFPSRREGMPNALLEAMASGLASVSSDIGGSRDLIRHGEDGYLHEVDDEQGMAASVAGLLQDPALTARIGATAHGKIVKGFSLEVTAERYLQLYRELLNRDRDSTGARSIH